MSYEDIRYELHERVATITINRPEVMNAARRQTYAEIEQALRAARDDDDVRVVVLTGEGRAFCAGDDVKEIFLAEAEDSEEIRARRLLDEIEALVDHGGSGIDRLLLEYPKPTLAAVNGVAVGYGCDIALQCDMRIAGTQARMGEFFIRRGLVPSCGGLLVLPRIVGIAHAYELVLTGRLVESDELERIGMVNRVVPQEALADEARALAELLAAQAPLAQKVAKQGLRQGMNWDLDGMLDYVRVAIGLMFRTEDHREGAMAFVERREAQFKGR